MASLDVLTNYWTTFVDAFVGKNTFQDYLLFIGVFVGIFLIFMIIDKVIIRILERAVKKTKNTYDDYVIGFLSGISWVFYAYLSLFAAAQLLTLDQVVRQILWFVLILFIGIYTGKGVGGIVDRLIEKKIEEKREKENLQNISLIKILGVFAKIFVWILILLMVLSNFGIEITPLIAGLGVGGIAIALALQSVLGDLFSAFVIFFDKPFTEGDFIIIGDDLGVVKHVGIKTTRIKTLQGQELVVSNSEMTSTRINNFKKMQKRRVAFSFGVTYDTSSKKLKKVKKIVAGIVQGANTQFKEIKQSIDLDRVHFKGFGDSSLDFEVVYYVPTSDYNKYMDIQEFINLALVEQFEKEKIKFAFPTRTVHLEK